MLQYLQLFNYTQQLWQTLYVGNLKFTKLHEEKYTIPSGLSGDRVLQNDQNE